LWLGIFLESFNLPEMAKAGRTYLNASVSFPPALLRDARERARRLGMSFSTYIQRVLEVDLKTRGALILEESEEAEPRRRKK